MSDRLDRIEAGLDETRKIVESNSRAIEAWANQSAEWANESAEYKRQTTVAIGRLTSISEQLAQLITTLAARQQDQENRLDRLDQ